jgi:hypothetical protein
LAGTLLNKNVGNAAVNQIAVANNATLFTGAATPDSISVYVGGSDNAVHRIDVASGTDAQQIGGLSFTPDLVAIKP